MRIPVKLEDNGDADASAVVAAAVTPATNGGGALSPPGPILYAAGEIVLADHKDRFYEAKVEKVEFRGEQLQYYIHYVGWKRHSCSVGDSWDEWLGVDRLMKCTEENYQKKIMIEKKYGKDKGVKARRVSQGRGEKFVGGSGKKQASGSPDGNQKKKRKRAIVEGSTPRENLFSIFIPPALRKQLIDDHEYVKTGKLVKLPRSPNVDEILSKYHDHRKERDGVIPKSAEEMLTGLRAYFDKAPPILLLYNKERKQYEEATVGCVSPSKLYGAEHLLRLFVKLPELLYNLNIEEETSAELQQGLQDLLKFLRKNYTNLFLPSYNLPDHSIPHLKIEDA